MSFANYKRAFKRLIIALNPICESYGKKKYYFLWNALKAFIRYGVTPNEYIGFGFYKKSTLEKKEFYTARHSDYYEPKFNHKSKIDIFNRKELTLKTFSDFVNRKWLYTPEYSRDEIERFLKSGKKIIVKPNNMSSGKGIHIYNDTESIDEIINNKCLLEEFVNQHFSLKEINSSSVNTIRIYSVKTIKNVNLTKWNVWNKGNTIIFSASIRVGGKNAEVDNFHAGGIGYPIDIRHGIVNGEGKNIIGERFSYHPSSGKKMIGFEIPMWDELLEYVFNLNQVVDEAKLIAWDIAITPNGFDLIEANCCGDPGFMQTPTETGFKRLIVAAL